MNPLPFESTLLKPWGKIYWEENKNKSGCKKSGGVFFLSLTKIFSTNYGRSRRGRDRMLVGFTTTYAISAYHH
jgi:uncharacterized DUF497 family protein